VVHGILKSRRSVSQQITDFYGNYYYYDYYCVYYVYKRPLLDLIPGQLNSFHIYIFELYTTQFNVMFLDWPRSNHVNLEVK
jgi:hypothetical protein